MVVVKTKQITKYKVLGIASGISYNIQQILLLLPLLLLVVAVAYESITAISKYVVLNNDCSS